MCALECTRPPLFLTCNPLGSTGTGDTPGAYIMAGTPMAPLPIAAMLLLWPVGSASDGSCFEVIGSEEQWQVVLCCFDVIRMHA